MIRFVFASDSQEQREALRDAVPRHPDVNLVSIAADGQEAVQLAVEYLPDVVVLTSQFRGLDGYEAAALISAVAPQIKLLLLCEDDSRESVERAMWRGVRYCLDASAAPEEILQAIKDVAALDQVRDLPQYQSAIDPQRFPRIVAVTGAKGGIGKTAIATNVAAAFAARKEGPTCLVDMYTQFGDVATALDVVPARSLVDLVESHDVIDVDTLQSIAVRHPLGVDVIFGSRTPQPIDALPGGYLEQVLWTLRQHYRFIVIDVPSILHDSTIRVLETVHTILLVCNLMDLSSVADTRRWLEIVQDAHVPRDRLRLVLNRADRANSLPVEQVEGALGLTAWATLPNDPPVVSRALNDGVPFVAEAPDQAISKVIRQMAEALSLHRSQEAGIGSVAVPERRSWLQFLRPREQSAGTRPIRPHTGRRAGGVH